jgi:hypothetical protein
MDHLVLLVVLHVLNSTNAASFFTFLLSALYELKHMSRDVSATKNFLC